MRLYEDPWFTFRFDEPRLVGRFHLDGVAAGTRVSVYRADPATGERLGLLAEAVAGESGWVEVPEPIVVRPGEVFVAVPEPGAG